MMTLPIAAAAALLLTLSAPRPAAAQEEEEEGTAHTAPGLSSRYVDCLQARTVDTLLASPVTQWGLSEELGKVAYDRIYGIQVCRGFVEDTSHYCRQLAKVPGRQDRTVVTKELGRDCATDVEFFRAHAALRAEGRPGVDMLCQRWCKLEVGKTHEKFDCAGFCAQVVPLMPDKGAQACKLWVERLKKQGASSEDVHDSLPECLMMLAPSPANCPDVFGPAAKRSCLDRHAVLEALRLKDPKRCPKSLRHGAVCAAFLAAPGKDQEAACLTAARAFTEPFCAERRQAGGLQDETKLPGDSEKNIGW